MSETILIVDDEDPVRRTFREWLAGAGLDCTLLTAHDAESALQLANQHTIDLAILDWALGAGDDGLQLLQDLVAFHPNVVAIMVTGFANQATPLDAMRMGVRDYLDKNQDLSKETFLKAVRKQLDLIRPAKRSREMQASLLAFRQAVEKVLPLVQSTAALQDPAPITEGISRFLGFVQQVTRARDGVLIVRHIDADKKVETVKVYCMDGRVLDGEWVPFGRSLAGAVVGMQQPARMDDLARGGVTLQPFEMGKKTVLAAPMPIAPGLQAVLELFDKDTGAFTAEDQRFVQSASEFGAELLRGAQGHRQMQQVLFDAVGAALHASERLMPGATTEPAPEQVLDQLKQGLASSGGGGPLAEQNLRLAEAIRVLGLRHGPEALEHCLALVEATGKMLDRVTGV